MVVHKEQLIDFRLIIEEVIALISGRGSDGSSANITKDEKLKVSLCSMLPEYIVS